MPYSGDKDISRGVVDPDSTNVGGGAIYVLLLNDAGGVFTYFKYSAGTLHYTTLHYTTLHYTTLQIIWIVYS